MSINPQATLDTGWIPLTLEDNWVQYSSQYGVPVYRKIGKTVYLRSLIKNGTGSVVATLPVGFRPSWQVLTVAQTAGNADDDQCRVDIATDGRILAYSYHSSWLSLGNISFLVD